MNTPESFQSSKRFITVHNIKLYLYNFTHFGIGGKVIKPNANANIQYIFEFALAFALRFIPFPLFQNLSNLGGKGTRFWA